MERLCRSPKCCDCSANAALTCGTAAITFDDGYAETVSTVQSLLDGASMPATFYVPSGAVDRSCEFWWDELEALILLSDQIPRQLVIEIDGHLLEWQQTDARREVVPRTCSRDRDTGAHGSIPLPHRDTPSIAGCGNNVSGSPRPPGSVSSPPSETGPAVNPRRGIPTDR